MVYLTRTTPALLASSPLTIQLFHCALRLAFLRVCIYERFNGTLSVCEHAHLTPEKRLLRTFVTKHGYTYVLIGKSSNLLSFEARDFRFSIDFSIGRQASSKNRGVLRFEPRYKSRKRYISLSAHATTTWKDCLFLLALKVTI